MSPKTLAAATPASAFITQDQFNAGLSALGISLRQLISESASSPVVSGYGAPLSVQAFAPSQVIDQLNGTTLNNVIVNGISGLTASNIPTNIVAANYLPLAGGTLTGALTVNGNFTAGSVSFSAASSTGVIAQNATTTNLIVTNATTSNLYVSANATLATTTIMNLVQNGPVYDIRAYGAKCDGLTDDTTSINNAISAAAKAGGTVLSPTGICITQPLTIAVPISIDLASSTWRLKSGSSGKEIEISASNVTIKNGTLDGNSSGAPSGTEIVFLDPGISNITLTGITFLNTAQSAVRSKGGSGPLNSNVTITDDTFNGAGNHAVYFNWKTVNSQISYNKFLGGSMNAIWVGNYSSNVQVEHNYITNYARMGIEMWVGDAQSQVVGNTNTIPGTSGDGISFDSATSSVVSDNIIDLTAPMAGALGIELVKSDNTVANGNVIVNAYTGMDADQTNGVVISNNTIDSFTGYDGILVTTSLTGNNASNNLIEGNRITLSTTTADTTGIFLQSNAAGSTVNGNQIIGNTVVGNGTTYGHGVDMGNYFGTLASTTVALNAFDSLHVAINQHNDLYTQSTGNTYGSVATAYGGSSGVYGMRVDAGTINLYQYDNKTISPGISNTVLLSALQLGNTSGPYAYNSSGSLVCQPVTDAATAFKLNNAANSATQE